VPRARLAKPFEMHSDSSRASVERIQGVVGYTESVRTLTPVTMTSSVTDRSFVSVTHRPSGLSPVGRFLAPAADPAHEDPKRYLLFYVFWQVGCLFWDLTLSPSIPLKLYTLRYWSNQPFIIFDIRALWHSGLSARAPECQKI